MPYINKVQIMGHLGRAPELRYTPNATPVCTVSLATTSTWKDKSSGSKVEKTEWHRVVFYARLAEVVAEHMSKGRLMHVEGRLQTRRWTDKDNIECFSTEIIGTEMLMLGKPERELEGVMERIEPAAPIEEDDIPF